MVKYKDTMVVFEEIPDRVSLAINITNCQNRCIGCHSPWLREDIGDELNEESMERLMNDNDGVNCVIFMGEGNDLDTLLSMAEHIREKYGVEVGIYSGRDDVGLELFDVFDYVKVGSYQGDKGPLNNPETNQRLFKCHKENGRTVKVENITHRMWRKKTSTTND